MHDDDNDDPKELYAGNFAVQFSSVPYVDGKTFALPPLCLSPH